MKNFILSLLFIVITLTGFAQTEPYGPVPYKTLEQTIGETYVLTRLFWGSEKFFFIKDAKGTPISSTDAGKSLKLISIDKESAEALLRDSLGLDYKTPIKSNKVALDLIFKSDLDEAQKLFLNKTLWLNVTKVYKGKATDEGRGLITGIRFEPVTVNSISPGFTANKPLLFTIKTPSGEYGFLELNISGTNSDLDPENGFNHYFLTKNPKLTYHFTPAVWKMVQAGYTEIGMPIDAFRLVMGFPKDINNTQTAKGTTVQWVYGTEHKSYYYFTNGKLTAKQD